MSELSTLAASNTWQTHEGRRIPIPEMVNEHLQNSIAMIKRGRDASGRRIRPEYELFLSVLTEEAVRRGLQPKEDGWDA
jgi:hypothetical protein